MMSDVSAKRAGHCAVCDVELFDITRYPAGHALAGEVMSANNPRAEAVRGYCLLSGGQTVMMTLCDACCNLILAGYTKCLRVMHRRNLLAMLRVRVWRHDIGMPLFPPLSIEAEAQELASLQALASQCIIGLLSWEYWLGFQQRTGFASSVIN